MAAKLSVRPLIQSPASVEKSELKRYLKYSREDGPPSPSDFQGREKELKTVLASTNTYEAISLAMASNRFNSFEAIYFEGIDTVSHLFMPFRPPQRPGISSVDFSAYSAAVDAFYVRQDEILGAILARADPTAGILIVSDHGFKSEADRPERESRINYASAASWHRKQGVLIASGGSFRSGVTLQEASILDLTPTILAYFGLPVGEDMQGRPMTELFQPQFLQPAGLSYGRIPRLDLLEGALESRPRSIEDCEARSGDLGSTFQIENAECCTEVDVILWLEIEFRFGSPTANFDIVGFFRANRHTFMWNVRQGR
jgi:hypothetical protein